jgi:hypothetical protein
MLRQAVFVVIMVLSWVLLWCRAGGEGSFSTARMLNLLQRLNSCSRNIAFNLPVLVYNRRFDLSGQRSGTQCASRGRAVDVQLPLACPRNIPSDETTISGRDSEHGCIATHCGGDGKRSHSAHTVQRQVVTHIETQ